MKRAIQLFAFNIPYPPDYGGVIDIFYKIKALSECGVTVYLHCFEYNRPKAAELEKYCAKVFYYPRKESVRYQLSTKPYIVVTRVNEQLLSNLSSNKAFVVVAGTVLGISKIEVIPPKAAALVPLSRSSLCVNPGSRK